MALGSGGLDFRFGEPVAGGAERGVEIAGGAGNAGFGFGLAEEHAFGGEEVGVGEGGGETAGEGVGAEIAPEVAAAAVESAIPIEDGGVPELGADLALVILAGGGEVLGAGEVGGAELNLHEFGVTDG